jgi:hypothetical protein
MEIPVEVLSDLMELGRFHREEVPLSLADPEKAWSTLLCGWDPWRKIAQETNESNLEALIKGYVLYSRARPSHSGGSVSPAIDLYRGFARRFPDKADELADWIFKYTTNPYEPFGSQITFGAKSLREYRERLDAHNRIADLNREGDQIRQKEDSLRKQTYEKERATKNIANAVRRGDLAAVKAFLDKGADCNQSLPNGESLVAFARVNGRNEVAEYLLSQGVS